VSRDFRHGFKQNLKSGFKKSKREEVAPRDPKAPTKQQREQALRHAVRTQDLEAFEDYDEYDA
jgi:hypothetical protein